MNERNTVLVGLALLAVLLWACVRIHRPGIETDLALRAASTLTDPGHAGVLVQASGRDLTLQGEVPSDALVHDGLRAVRAVWGVRSARSALTITVPERPAALPLRASVRRLGEGLVLLGNLPDQNDVRTLHEAAVGLLGPERVDSRLHAGSQGSVAGMTQGLVAAMPVVLELEDGLAEATPLRLLVTGVTPELDGAVAAARVRIAPHIPLDYELLVELRARDSAELPPLEVRADRSGDGVVLSGTVADSSARSAILAAARELWPEDGVDDRLVVTDRPARPSQPTALVAALPYVKALRDGRAIATVDRLRVVGLADDTSGRAAAREAINKVIPAEHAVEVEVEIGIDAERCEGLVRALLAREKIRFASSSAEVLGSSQQLIQSIAATLSDCPASRIQIEGHTDAQGSDAFNLELSQARADAVKERLVTLGLDPTRMGARGYGESRPRGDNSTQAGRAANRRIEFKLEEGE